MVWAFVGGICVGFPVGCYLREKGYSAKLRGAYQIMTPNKEHYTTDNLEKLMPDRARN